MSQTTYVIIIHDQLKRQMRESRSSQSSSGVLLYQYHCICRPGSLPITVHLPNLSLVVSVRIQIDPLPSQSLPEIRIDQTSFSESYLDPDHDQVVYAVRWAAVTVSIIHSFSSDRRMSILIYGYDLFESPDKSQLVDLLNLSAWFRHRSAWSNLIYTDLLCGLALIDSRSFLQASEILYSAANLLGQNGGSSAEIRTICSREALLLLSAAALFPTSKSDQLLLRLGEISGQTLTMEHLRCIDRIQSLIDIISQLLAHSLSYVRQAAARTLEFLLETIGCESMPVLETVICHLLMVHDGELIEPILQAIVTNLFMMSPDSIQSLMQDVFEPALHQSLQYSISTCSIATALRLVLAAFQRLKSEGDLISDQIVSDVMMCFEEKYVVDLNWILDQVWDHILQYAPESEYETEIVQICASKFNTGSSSSSWSTTCIRKSLQLISRIAAVHIDNALDGRVSVQYDLNRLISNLTVQIMSELGRGDHVDLDLFDLYWKTLLLIITLHNTIHTAESEFISIDEIAIPLLNAATQILRHASPRPALVQVMRTVVPALEPDLGLLRFLRQMLIWVPYCVQDEVFDLIHILIMKLRSRLDKDQIRDLVTVWCHRSTARSDQSNRCRSLIQDIIIQQQPSDTLLCLFKDLIQTTDPTQFRDLIQFISETVESIETGHDLDLCMMISYLRPILIDDLHTTRSVALHMIKQIIMKPHIHLDSAVLQAVLDCAETQPDAPAQFAISELIGIMFERRAWPWPITSRSWTYLQIWHHCSHWDNIRRMTRWASLIITRRHFSNDNLDQAWRLTDVSQLWHQTIMEACQSRTCAQERLWGLQLIWLLAFRSGAVLRYAPSQIRDLIESRRYDRDSDVGRAAQLLMALINEEEGVDEAECSDLLSPGSRPDSLTEIVIKSLDHLPPRPPGPGPGPVPARTSQPSPEPEEIDDVWSDELAEGIEPIDLDHNTSDHDRSSQGEVSIRRSTEFMFNMDEMMKTSGDDKLNNSSHELLDRHGEQPDDDLLDLSLIHLQLAQD